MSQINKFTTWLTERTDGHVLGLFRMLYGLFMAYEMAHYMRINLVRNMFELPKINFHYDFLYWIKPLPPFVMHGIVMVLLLLALLIAAGIWFRWACRVFALGYAYIFLIDKSIYNNHIYLFILLAVLLSCTDADRFLSLRKKSIADTLVPRWQVFILQAQIVIVYFYGGIAKLTMDWLFRKEPVTSLLGGMPANHLLAPFLKNDFGINLLTYGGLLLDILAPVLLWYKPVRRFALPVFIGFHLMNDRIFDDIGIFPFVMLSALFIFFETKDIPLFRNFAETTTQPVQKNKKTTVLPVLATVPTPMIRRFLVGYFVFQLLFPLRGFLLPNPLDYTTIGNRFSWRMKVDTRKSEKLDFSVINAANGQASPVQVQTFINDHQMNQLLCDPRSIVDFSKLLKSLMIERGITNGYVKANIQVRYNGREPKAFVDPAVDLSAAACSPFKPIDWLMPLSE